MIKEFKEFISKGNVLDLAVGVIVGGAFSSIVTSLVNNIFTPIIGILVGGKNFSSLAIKIGDSSIMYGAFIQSIIDFLIVASCLFLVVKFVNKLKGDIHKINKKGSNKEEVVEVKKSNEEVLLEEIRDLLKENKKGAK